MTIVINPFTQADGNLSGWTALAGATTCHVTSNQIDAPVSATAYGSTLATGITFTTFGLMEIVGTQSAGTIAIGWIDASINGYILQWDTAGAFRITRLNAGAPTTVASGTVGLTGTHKIRFEKQGSAVRGFIDDKLDVSGSDATFATSGTIVVTINETSGASTADTLMYSNEIFTFKKLQTNINQAVQRAAVR